MPGELDPIVVAIESDSSPEMENQSQQEQTSFIPSPRFNNLVKNMKVVRNYSQPTLLAFLPNPVVANGSAVIICPGGGFSCLPIDIEGIQVADWLTSRGIATFVLKYRLLPTATDDSEFVQQLQRPNPEQMKSHIPLAAMDGKQSMKLVCERSAEWGIDPQRIGILGFSAGGVVASAVATEYDADTRPSFVASIYSPGIQDFPIRADLPPLFIAFASDDPVLSLVSSGSMAMYSAWKDLSHSVELHIYSKGGHGFGMTKQGLPCDHWIDRFGDWLQIQGFLGKQQSTTYD